MDKKQKDYLNASESTRVSLLVSNVGWRNFLVSKETVDAVQEMRKFYWKYFDFYLKYKDKINVYDQENIILVKNLERVGGERLKQQQKIEKLEMIVNEREKEIKKAQQELSSIKYQLASNEDKLNTLKSQIRAHLSDLELLTKEEYETFDD